MKIIALVILLIVAVVACWNWYRWFMTAKVITHHIAKTGYTLPTDEEVETLTRIIIKEMLNIK